MNKNLSRFYEGLESKSNFLLFDIEANYYENNGKKDFETIQIGYVKFTYDYNIINKGSIFIKPTNNYILNDFIKELTGITQEQVNKGVNFDTGLKEFMKMYNPVTDYIMSYGYYDMKQLFKDCNTNQIPYPFLNCEEWKYDKHINIKNAVAKKLNIREKGMGNMLSYLELSLDGVHHNGEDDCVNILKIVKNVFNS